MNSDTLLLANAGTALMWASACHLVAGNLVIGLVEGLLISLFVKGRRWKAAGWMILANYASAWLGYVLLTVGLPLALRTTEQRITIENLVAWHVAALAVAYVLTLVVEFPFVVAALGRDVRFGTRIRVNLLAQTASYVLLVGGYALVSANSIAPWGLTVAKPATFARDADVWAYYVGQSGAVVRIRTDGMTLEHVANLPEGRPTGVFARRRDDQRSWDLFVHVTGRPLDQSPLAIAEFARDVAFEPNLGTTRVRFATSRGATGNGRDHADPNGLQVDAIHTPVMAYHSFASRFDVSRPAARTIVAGGWPIEGLRAFEDRRPVRRIAVETPLVQWLSQHPVILPSGQIVYQLGEQIVLLDLEQKKIGLLDIGTGLVVARETSGH